MATIDVVEQQEAFAPEPPRRRPAKPEPNILLTIWRALGSLKFTVPLLILLMLLVMAGTLAQKQSDIWEVVNDNYFRVWFAKIEVQTFATLMGVFQPNDYDWERWFWFPGGYLIGAMMSLNLLAAHTVRYKVVARGNRLLAALGLLALGCLATWFVIARAFDSAHEATLTASFAGNLWNLCRGVYAGLALGAAYLLSLAWNRIRKPEWFTLAALNMVLLAVAVFLFTNPEWRIPDAGMRIVWQGIQATLAGGLLMASLWLLFGKRSGVILIHIGIAMLMAHEFYVAETNVEAKMIIAEGDSTNWVYDDRDTELAIIDRSNPDTDRVTVIPEDVLVAAAKSAPGAPERTIRHEDLPVDVKLVEYFKNVDINPLEVPSNDASLRGSAITIKGTAGDKDAIQKFPGAYVELLDKESGESLGKYLVTTLFDKEPAMSMAPYFSGWKGYPTNDGEQIVEGGDRPLAISLRYLRIYKPYDVRLKEFSFDRFAGSTRAKNYSADVTLTDNETGSVIDFLIYMNNPLRYRGETFYQAGFDQWTEKSTILQVVENESWMVPYIACAAVGVGMMFHFGLILLRFLNRRWRELALQEQPEPESIPQWLASPSVVVPVLFGLLAAGYVASKLRPQPLETNGVPLASVASLPMLDEGRVKPFDTVARNLLQWYSQRQEAYVSLDDKSDRIPATQWMLDVVSGKSGAEDYYVFRITNPELLSTLELEKRPGFYRYSISEVRGGIEKLVEQAKQANDMKADTRTLYQNEVLKLWSKLSSYNKLIEAFSVPMQDPNQAIATLRRLRATQPVRCIVPQTADGEWETLFEGIIKAGFARSNGEPMNEATLPMVQALDEWAAGNEARFLEAVEKYHEVAAVYEQELSKPKNFETVAKMKTVEKLNTKRIQFETWFNSVAPFYYSSILYILAMVLSVASWLGLPRTFRRSAMAVIAITFLLHTLAIAARVYISDRPPITNLYTTAICIGWAMVLLMMVIESIFKLGFGSFLAALAGFVTLLVAHGLGQDGDTFTVMQAVLDTQFWLTTHVLTINFGYATTIGAGLLGIVHIIAVEVLDLFNKKERKQLFGMMYGTLCFATLASFIGTVLGGLWADDSWGRFWGWDPKENGALLIVLWNAVALHARWDKMIGARGFAMLTIVGNIVTAWSWFGVNQLSVGLHNYGFDPNLAKYLWWFFVSQVVLLVIGAIPWSMLFDRDSEGSKEE